MVSLAKIRSLDKLEEKRRFKPKEGLEENFFVDIVKERGIGGSEVRLYLGQNEIKSREQFYKRCLWINL